MQTSKFTLCALLWFFIHPAKVLFTPENCKCRLYRERDEAVNHIISECSNLVRKVYMTGYER